MSRNLNISGLHLNFLFLLLFWLVYIQVYLFFQSLLFQQRRINIKQLNSTQFCIFFLFNKIHSVSNGSVAGFNLPQEQLGWECNLYCHLRLNMFARGRYLVNVDGDNKLRQRTHVSFPVSYYIHLSSSKVTALKPTKPYFRYNNSHSNILLEWLKLSIWWHLSIKALLLGVMLLTSVTPGPWR